MGHVFIAIAWAREAGAVANPTPASRFFRRFVMAKRPKPRDDELVTVIVATGFRHNGAYVRTGDTVQMTPREAADMAALHMVRLPKREAA
jgi:hypothetical protein